jgi:hypothetical protein
MLYERIDETNPTDRPNRPQDVRAFIANDALLARPIEPLIQGCGGAPQSVQDEVRRALEWGVADRQRGLATKPDRLMPGQ